jgi:hypothetical protein
MGIPAPRRRPATFDPVLLLLPLVGTLLGVLAGSLLGETVLGAILGASAGLLAATTLRALRALPADDRGVLLLVVAAVLLCGVGTLALLGWR